MWCDQFVEVVGDGDECSSPDSVILIQPQLSRTRCWIWATGRLFVPKLGYIGPKVARVPAV